VPQGLKGNSKGGGYREWSSLLRPLGKSKKGGEAKNVSKGERGAQHPEYPTEDLVARHLRRRSLLRKPASKGGPNSFIVLQIANKGGGGGNYRGKRGT